MATREIDAIGAAIAATEKEIATEAWDQEESVQDETGDRTVEQMGEGLEGQHEPDDDDEEAEGEESTETEEAETGEEAEGEDEGEDAEGETKIAAKEAETKDKPEAEEPEIPSRVPGHRLREQTEKTKAAEARATKAEADLAAATATSKQEIAALNARLDGVLAAMQRTQPQAAKTAEADKPATAPDFFEDPTGFLNHQTKPILDRIAQFENNLAAQRVETSMAIAHGKHGDVFAQAFEAVQKLDPRNPDDQATVRRIYASANPGEELVSWHRRNETLRRVGNDPDKYEKDVEARVRETLMKDPEFRKQLIDGARAEAAGADGGRPRNITRLPKSLNGAVGGRSQQADPHMYDDSDQAVADAAWR